MQPTHRVTQADGADVGVRLSTKFRWAAAERLGLSEQLHVCLNANYGLILHLCMHQCIDGYGLGCKTAPTQT